LTPGGTVGQATFARGDTAAGGQGRNAGNIPCTAGSEAYHIHAHLSLFVNGQQIAIPADIGIAGTCLYALHTHDATGIIHVEAAAPGAYTLGQFFDIWGELLSPSGVAGFDGPATAYVDGAPYAGDLRSLVLAAHQQITLEVGTPLVTPPTYNFPPGY